MTMSVESLAKLLALRLMSSEIVVIDPIHRIRDVPIGNSLMGPDEYSKEAAAIADEPKHYAHAPLPETRQQRRARERACRKPLRKKR